MSANNPNRVLVMPGDCLVKYQNDLLASNGTYLKNGYIYASIAGYMHISEQKETLKNESTIMADDLNNTPSSESKITKRIIKVVRPDDHMVPFLEQGSIVTCRVIRVTSSYAKCSIICIEDYILKQPYTGILRLDDIQDLAQQNRAKHVIKSCRPGDIILAKVIAPYENHQFLLTTASPQLGVVVAINDWCEPMIPISLTEVFCQRTFTKESRKVANINLIR
ncbi:Exosome complex component CSL4 [Sarcoptes scabiei]|uniref:Exosome complex component CSL4 n=1 Tax=Sarcoptes scabiei TaxID=52283 RepID=A0A132A4B8_SARSC|nr:Exosome complex component CSL4 [Sarcoptes scabiei]KPM05465.1 exosome complex component CSL4-like protein [Sarcoptes scabiei]UXI17612.1 LYR motif-containing protein 5B-like [Sarcoptes scabiei]